MDQAMNVNDWYLFQGAGDVIGFHRVVGPRVMGLAPDESAIAAAMPRAHVVFRELARLLGGQPYFAGAALSLADLLIAPQLSIFALTPEWAPLTAKAPNLIAWLERMDNCPSMKATAWERVAAMAKAA
jgi:glutathione S-transferase